jgi:hypothetical protein
MKVRRKSVWLLHFAAALRVCVVLASAQDSANADFRGG